MIKNKRIRVHCTITPDLRDTLTELRKLEPFNLSAEVRILIRERYAVAAARSELRTHQRVTSRTIEANSPPDYRPVD